MSTTTLPAIAPSGPREQLATRLTFLVVGAVTAAFAPLVPLVKARLGADEGTLGLLLLFLGLGSITAMPIAGYLTTRLGCRPVILVAGAIMVLVFPFLAVLDSWIALAVTIAIFGAAVGTCDVAMNIQAVMVERDSGRSMMSGFHGLYSLGGMIGAAGMSFLLAVAGIAPLPAAIGVIVAGALCLLFAASGLLPYGDQSSEKTPPFVMPRGAVLFIGVLCLLTFLSEGAILDWSAVFLTSVRGADIGLAGLGYAAFAVAMTLGRLFGDNIRQRLGEKRVLISGGILGALGFVIVLAVPSVWAGLFGYFLVGAGASNLVPVLFSVAGRSKDMPSGLAVTAVSTLGYLGILLGPAIIGFLAHATSLSAAFIFLAAALLFVAANYRMADR